MASRKDMMGLDAETLRTLAMESGINFPAGMKKSSMVKALEEHEASGWLETNSQLLHGEAEGGFDNFQGFTGFESESISDAARVAQQLAGAGYTETFHSVMNGGTPHAVEAVHAYMNKLGVAADDVWMHMPKANPNIPAQPFNFMKGYLNNHWDDYQDIMPPIAGHYAGDIMGEYATNKGHVGDSYEHLAHMYLNKAEYNNPHAYQHDVTAVAHRLAGSMGAGFLEVAFGSATGAKVGYHSILPQMGDPSVVGGVRHPREALNAAGLPLGSQNIPGSSPDRERYSFVSSVTGRPEGNDEFSAAIRGEVSSTLKSLAKTYQGGSDVGLNPHKHQTSEYDMVMDSATRYVGIEDARSGYKNLDDTSYSASNIRAVIENNFDRMDEEEGRIVAASNSVIAASPARISQGTEFSAEIGPASSYNSARMRREEKAIADLDASYANFREVADGGYDNASPIRYHNFEQGTQEWLDFRSQYDITGSTVGSILGSNEYTRPWKALTSRLGLHENASGGNRFQEAMFAKGHKTEDEARIRVSKEFGVAIQQTGAITNDQYPGMMYSPDGLIGDDTLWEHKNPERAGKFANLAAGDHPDYMDQIQMGMLVSGRNKTLFSQTIGSETRNEWVEQDPDWFTKNETRLNSARGRLAAGREFLENNQGLEQDALVKGARSAMTGDGIWRDVSQRSDRGYSPAAGTSADPFVGLAGSGYNPSAGMYDPYDSSGNLTGMHSGASAGDKGYYVPNFTMPQGGELMNVSQGLADPSQDRIAQSVKTGFLLANDEIKARQAATGAGSGQKDADFGPRNFSEYMDAMIPGSGGGGDVFGGGGGRSGGGGDDGPGMWGRAFGSMGDSLYGGLRSGTLRGLQNGTMDSLEAIPVVGGILRGGLGVLGAGGEAIATMNNYRGMAEDAGMTSGVGYDSMTQGLEMMGLNANQASQANQTVHSIYNRMANGDPSAAAQLSVATRGLLTLGDVRNSGGDSTRLAEIFRTKAQARGWSQERIAGAAEMAGLDGFARVATRSDYTMGRARENVDTRLGEDVSESNVDIEFANTDRAQSSPTYFAPRYTQEHGGSAIRSLGNSMSQGFNALDSGVAGAAGIRDDIVGMVEQLESGGNLHATNPSSSARGSMQVLSGTRKDPGYGVTPAKDNSPEELRRVGIDYQQAMFDHYNGDLMKGAAAYVAGPGAVDEAIKKYGNSDWLKHIDPQAQNRVKQLQNLGAFNGGSANSFRENGSQGQTPVNITVNINAKVNNREGTATVRNPYSGEQVTTTVNLQGQASRSQ